MKITAKMLTNKVLVGIVQEVINAKLLPDHIILGYYRHGLIEQVKSIERQLQQLDKKAKNKKLTRKEAVAIDRKQYRLATLGNKKIAILNGLENATDKTDQA